MQAGKERERERNATKYKRKGMKQRSVRDEPERKDTKGN